MTKKAENGFTLIELLVVISIISLLSSVVFTSLSAAKTKAHDARRKSDANQIALAIELYFNANGSYPVSSGAIAPNSSWANSSDNTWTSLASELSPFISPLPKDPKQSLDPNVWAYTGQAYSYVNCGRSYMFVYRLEQAQGPDPGSSCYSTPYQYGGNGANTNIKTVGSSF